MTDSVFNAYSRYYDLLYRDKDYSAEVSYVVNLLRRYGINEGGILEFGSGTGKHGALLAKQGFEVRGIERSAEMVAQAQHLSGFTCQQGDIRTAKLGRTFDAVLSLFHVVSYQTTNESVQAVFARASEHLRYGGIFVFDIWYSPAVYAQKPEVRLKRVEDDATEIVRIAEPVIYSNESRVDVNYTIYARDKTGGQVKIIQESHPMRHFSLPELDWIAQLTGFERVRVEEFLTGDSPSESTWGVCLVMKKKND